MSFNNASDTVNACTFRTIAGQPSKGFPFLGTQARGWGGRQLCWQQGEQLGGWVRGRGAVQHRGGTVLWDGREQSGERGEWSIKRKVRSSMEKYGIVKRWVETIFLRYWLSWGELSLLLQGTPAAH